MFIYFHHQFAAAIGCFLPQPVFRLTLKERVLGAFLSPVEFIPSFGLCQILYPCQRLHLSQTLKCNYYDLSLFGVNKILPGIFCTEVCSWEKSSLYSLVLSRAVLHVLSKLPSSNCSANCPATAALLSGMEDELCPLQFCSLVLLRDYLPFIVFPGPLNDLLNLTSKLVLLVGR